MAMSLDSRVENYSEIDQQSAFYSYINHASQLFAPQLFAHQALMPTWPFHPSFFPSWPLSTPMPYASPPGYNLMSPINPRPEANITNKNYVSIENHSLASGSVSPASADELNHSVEMKKVVEKTKKVFECKTCKKTFGYKHVLQNHEKVHTGEKSFRCEKCGRKFRRDHHLKVHMRLHSGEKPFSCLYPNCDKKFVQVANQRRHMKVHENSNCLQVHDSFLASESSDESLDLRKPSQIRTSDNDFELNFDTSDELRYESPEQSEPEDLSTKVRSRVRMK